jgi:hypothetical protein
MYPLEAQSLHEIAVTLKVGFSFICILLFLIFIRYGKRM